MKSILLADDETIVSAEFAKTLERFGYRVETAQTFESALRCAEHAHFDVILVEFNLRSESTAHPRAGNGLQLVHQLRAAQLKVPLLIFTAMEGELYEKASLDSGADDFILKTKSIPSILARIHAHLRSYERNLRTGTASGLGRNTSKFQGSERS
jgi:two-component system OmpR family response regulator